MSRFTFRAPVDVTAANIRILTPNNKAHNFFATPRDKTFEIADAAPGRYRVAIEPLGQPVLTYAFEASPDTTSVEAPRLAELKMGEAFEIPEALAAEPEDEKARPETRAMTVGLSYDSRPGEIGGWLPYEGPPPSVEALPSGLNIVFDDAVRLAAREPIRLRMSVVVAGHSVERFLVPLYAGGATIAFRNRTLSSNDLDFRIRPNEPMRRALAKVLEAGHSDAAAKIAREWLESGPHAPLADGDPWTALLLSHLAIRFPRAPAPEADWIGEAAGSLHHITDAHILAAWGTLRSARSEGRSREEAARAALRSLERGRSVGAPYYASSSSLMGEMLSALAAMEPLHDKAAHLVSQWDRDLTFKRSHGLAFSWVMSSRTAREGGKFDAETVFAPPRGGLKSTYSKILFEGEIEGGRIRPRPGRTAQPSRRKAAVSDARPRSYRLADAPLAAQFAALIERPLRDDPPPAALSHRVAVPEDPHKGRFGGVAARGGFELDVRFARVRGRWVDLTLRVRTAGAEVEPYVDHVVFYLHPTFRPDRVTAVFRGSSAEAALTAYGGFTVGAWLPRQKIELELDLAEVENAPEAIREL